MHAFVEDLAAVARALLAETGDERIAYGIGSSFGGIATAVAEAHVEGTIFATSVNLDIFAATPNIEAPVLLVCADRGSLPAQAFDHLRQLLPRCTMCVPDARHLLPLEAPELTVRLLREFAVDTPM